MDELALLEQYFWILERCKDPEKVFSERPVEKEFAFSWLLKLCLDVYKGLEAKRLRNLYLLELARCIDNAELSQELMRVPPTGRLPPFTGASNIKIDRKAVVREMEKAAADYGPSASPRNYHTHLSTKVFDDNRGACAYLAVSLGDPKEQPIWLKMGSQEPYLGEEACLCSQEECGSGGADVDVDFGEFCLNAIARELSGQAEPLECPELEVQLEKYARFIRDYEIGEQARGLSGTQLRTFLLINFQTDLVQALRSV